MNIDDREPSRMLLMMALFLLVFLSVAAEAAVARAYPVVPVLPGLASSPGRMLIPGSNTTRPNLSSHILILANGMWTPLATREHVSSRSSSQSKLAAVCACWWPAPPAVYRNFRPFDAYGGLSWFTEQLPHSPLSQSS